MAIVSVSEIHDGREGGTDLSDKKSVRTTTRCFRVTTDSVYDADWEVCRALPYVGSPHPKDPNAYLVSKRAKNESFSKYVWIATLKYTTDRPREENPCDDPAVIEWSTDTVQEPFDFDAAGDPILNSALDPFADRLKDEVSYWTVAITKNLPFVPTWINDYRDAVNSDFCYIDGVPIDIGMAKVKSIRIGKWQYRNDFGYRELQLTLKIKDDWKKHVLDQGLYCWIDDPLNPGYEMWVPCGDENGKDVKKPAILDGSGHQVPPRTTPTSSSFLTFDLRNTKPFANLPLN
jgi:hypothetical protein